MSDETCDCKNGACDCNCGSGCDCDCCGEGTRFPRRYLTKAEQIAELEAYLADLKLEVQAVEEAVAREESELQDEISRLERDRSAVTQLLNPEYLAVYERLHRGLAGRVVVPVRDELCQGCHLPLTPQTISQLMSNQELITCHRCGRILYLEQEGTEVEEESRK